MSRATVFGILTAVCCMSGPGIRAANPASEIRIGMIDTMFRDVPPGYVKVASNRFSTIVKGYTGMPGVVDLSPDAETLAKKLSEGTVDVGVFHGIEFAHASVKNPELEPLVVAVPTCDEFKAVLVCRDDSKASGFGDLEGTVAQPKGNREHCRVYFAHHAGEKPMKTTEPISIADALDAVVTGEVTATVVDRSDLESYSRAKPGCGKRLKVLDESVEFPISVIVYRKGGLSPALLSRFSDGLTQVHTSRNGRFMMRLWKLSKFTKLPGSYLTQLAAIRKAYPIAE